MSNPIPFTDYPSKTITTDSEEKILIIYNDDICNVWMFDDVTEYSINQMPRQLYDRLVNAKTIGNNELTTYSEADSFMFCHVKDDVWQIAINRYRKTIDKVPEITSLVFQLDFCESYDDYVKAQEEKRAEKAAKELEDDLFEQRFLDTNKHLYR